ncbi:NAD-dependent epimerase/dehydratase family protein [Pedococcus soli]
MRILVLGGTAWLGGEVAAQAVTAGHRVTALARGRAGEVPAGVSLVRADRSTPGAYDALGGADWDAVVDVARQPSQVRGALAALADRARSWVFVSSASVYASHDDPGADESAPLLDPSPEDDEGSETYGARKVACEQAVLGAIPDRALVARAGLVAGPGDHTDRTGYWPLRFAHPATADGAVLVPDSPIDTQVIDVRDLAAWLLHCAEVAAVGVANAAGSVVPLPDHLRTARQVTGHDGELVGVSQDWLAEHEVAPWSGERSLPLWLPLPEYAGMMSRSTAAAESLGLRARPLAQTLEDTLAWELAQGPGRPRRAGLAPADEVALVDLARAVG